MDEQTLFSGSRCCQRLGFARCFRIGLVSPGCEGPDRVSKRELRIFFGGCAGALDGVFEQDVFVLVERCFHQFLGFH